MVLSYVWFEEETYWTEEPPGIVEDGSNVEITFSRPSSGTGPVNFEVMLANGEVGLIGIAGGTSAPYATWTLSANVTTSIATYNSITNPFISCILRASTVSSYYWQNSDAHPSSLVYDGAFTPLNNIKLAIGGSYPSEVRTTSTLTDKSVSGTGIITADITGDTEWFFFLDGKHTHSFSIVVDGGTNVFAELYYHDPADPAAWVVDAALGFIPDAKAFEQSTSSYQYYTSTLTGELDTVNEFGWKTTSGEPNPNPGSANAPYLSSPGYYATPFGVKLTSGGNSKWYAFGTPMAPNGGQNDTGTGTDTGGNSTEGGPGLDPDGVSYGDWPTLNPGDTPTAGGHKPYIDVSDPEAPKVRIQDPTGSDVDLPPNTGWLPPGTAGDAPITLVNSGRLLYVYYGGDIITTYVIPQAIWDGLSTSVQQYVGYTDTNGAEINAPAEVTITVLIGYIFQAGTYMASMGNRPYLWVWAQNFMTKDYLVTSGVTRVTEAPTQDEIDAADKHIAGGRGGQPTLTYTEAVQAADAFNAAIVTPVAP